MHRRKPERRRQNPPAYFCRYPRHISPAIDNNDFKIALLQTTTPLTIYGQVGDIPYYYSDASTAINRGAVTDLKLTYAYAKVAVRVQKAGKTEAVENYTVSSDVLSLPKKTDGSSYEWNTSEAKPKLVETTNRPSTKNTNTSQASNLDCSNANECMEVTPATISENTDKLFILTETSGNSKTYNVSSLADDITIKAGYVYLFTVDLDKEAAIIQTDITLMDKDEFEFRSSPGLYTLQDLLDFRDAWNTSGESGISSNVYAKWMDNTTLTVKLLTDIDLNNKSWTPIKDFIGTFEGGRHTISNLTVTDASDAAGLFGTIKAPFADHPVIIQNLNVKNATVASSSDCGVICGSSDNSRILDCNVSGVVKVSSSSGNAGGIVGNVTSGSWLQRCNAFCSATSSVTGNTNAGGIVGNTEVDVFGCAVNNISTISATSVGSIAGTAANMYSCIACNVSTLNGTCSSSPYGNATASNCHFMIVADQEGEAKYMEYMSGRIMDDFNNELYTFYQSHASEPYATQYKFVGAAIPASFPPTLQAGTPAQKQERTPGIYTGHELVAFSKAWNSGDATEQVKYRIKNTVTIMNDIDMKGIAYTAIDKISGTIIGADGKQQRIANLCGDVLVNSLSGSLTIKDLILKDAVTSIGGFVNLINNYTLTLEYCRRIGGSTINNSKDDINGNDAGGLVNRIADTGVFYCVACSVEDMTLIKGDAAGGILGADYSGGRSILVGCLITNVEMIEGNDISALLGVSGESATMRIQSVVSNKNKLSTSATNRGAMVGIKKKKVTGGSLTSSINYYYWDDPFLEAAGKLEGDLTLNPEYDIVQSWNEDLQTLLDKLNYAQDYMLRQIKYPGDAYIWQGGEDCPVMVRNSKYTN